MALCNSATVQLGYPLINAVGHFMGRLNTKTHRLYIKYTCIDMGFITLYI